MPKVPVAVMSTSSDDSDDSDDPASGLDADSHGTNWTVVNMASIESFPFSEVSHQPYGMESTYLDSVSHGSGNLRIRNSIPGAQDASSLILRTSLQCPRFPLAQKSQTYLHSQSFLCPARPHGSDNTSGSMSLGAASGVVDGKDKDESTTPNVSSVVHPPPLIMSKPVLGVPIDPATPGAPPMPRRGRKPKPVSRRTRALQICAPRWRDRDGDVELLVQREVGKRELATPTTTEVYAALSFDTPGNHAMPSAPPLSVAPSSKDRGKGNTESLPMEKPVKPSVAKNSAEKNCKGESAAAVASTSDVQLSSAAVKCNARSQSVCATRLPLEKRATPSPELSNAAPPLIAGAQRQPLSNSFKKNDPSGAPSLCTFSAMPPEAPQSPSVAPSSSTTTAQSVDISSPSTAASPALSATRRILPVGQIKASEPYEASTVTSSTVSLQASSNSRRSVGDVGAVLTSSSENEKGDEGSSRDYPTCREKPERSLGHLGRHLAKSTGGVSDAPILPFVSSPVASADASSICTTTTTSPTPMLEAAASPDCPRSAIREQRRCSGRQRLLSILSTDADARDTVTNSVDTIVLRMHARLPTLQPLITSPDEPKPLHLPFVDNRRSPDTVRSSLAPLSPQQLSSVSLCTPTHSEHREEGEIPSLDASTTRHSGLSTATTTTKLGLTHTVSAPLEDSPPTLRPQTREFKEKMSLSSGAASFVSPGSRAAAEKLVSFVRAVSDPEVLHVIHDYLVEHQRTTPRYRLAAIACEELLERKEELLKAQEPVESLQANGTGQSSTFNRASEAEPFTINVKQSVEINNAADKAEKLHRLLAEIEAEHNGKEDKEDPAGDEFDDFNFFDSPYPKQSHFNFGRPTVSGAVSRVFAEGMLFKIKTSSGEYYFYNDTLQDVMMVRTQFVLSGKEVINERAMLAPVEGSKETEITIAVLPEETNFFMSGVAHLPQIMAKRVAVPPDYVSPSVTQSLRKVNAEINSVRTALGKWSRASDQAAFLKCCLKNHLKFTDLTFRPCAESLCRHDCDAVSIAPVTWRRPEEYVYLPEVSQTRLFRGEISCFMVKQGELNNHTVVAAMAAVAQYPDHVRWMFRHPVSAHVGKMERAEGCYRVTLLHNGWWKTYVIDDYVPASQQGPLFACCAEDPRRLWVPLLEKAYAKCLGSYAATCVMDAMKAMGDFTGFPVRYLDSLWATAKSKPTDAPARALFNYVSRVVRMGCTVLLFTPDASDEQAKNTVDLSRTRSSRLLPVKGVIPQFLPGHIYFLHDVAFYEELDLRMARLKNPWTWETRNNMNREKKWKYTTWYDRPDVSTSAMGGSLLSSSGAPSSSPPFRSHRMAEMTEEERVTNNRKGTMWVEWGEVLAAFAGGGVCYTLWNYHRYRVKNVFADGLPRVVLEMKARRKIEVFVTLSLETVSETLDSYGTVVASRPTPLYGTAISVVQRLSQQSAHVVSESCEDVECIAARRTYVVAKDVSMKLTIDPRVAEGTVLVVPLLHPQAMEVMATAASVKACSGGASSSQLHSEVHFVLSLVTDAVAGDSEDLFISFVSMRRSCGVFTDSKAPFNLEGISRVTSPYQICTVKGVKTLEGNRICDTESVQRPS